MFIWNEFLKWIEVFFGISAIISNEKFIMNGTAAGSRVKMDIREDEEQEIKCQEVMELFLTAGYFRARIKVINTWFRLFLIIQQVISAKIKRMTHFNVVF